ncbi:Glycerol-3-phosphate ABC transporter periplasmic glycerol-3-phosphate-binding protein [Pseudomonas syringae pv. helianthi]|uniref:sn-glycerol-3-phosphate-binding periplasmic protein UgpB n=3 Tax=Pseudomonas TaxID=286 RepID=A0A0P9TPA3_9PSED|nr:Glycerol-3-phosphate ABC transporter periplasmic glycerol-3-phosphate-binding protein [Pseudomonas syringae pv. helianthi]RMR10505.1 Glycerol-3-phosphate ABC transporter periplasmic glycerol-3-phosphate-binding protein [Pseudomonas syringae pv. helianthi]RMV11816.1 Glycerol-3-phosphate ABC transporter periplasmic glycerol-3-phosphate-binding protein [Pseudomonas savastanoi]
MDALMPFISKKLSVLALLPLAAQVFAAPAEFWYSHGGAAGSAIADLCRSFNAQREDEDRLHCIRQGSYEQTLQKTVAAYRAGIGPALVEIYDVATPDMLLGGATRPVEAVMAHHQRAYSDDTFLPALRRYYSDEQGVLAAQPFAASTAVLYTHRNALAAAGISEPPATWEAFAEALRALKKNGHTCPAVTEFAPWIWLEQTSAAQGTEVATRAAGNERYQFDKGAHLRLMNDLTQWAGEGLVVHEDSTRSGQQALAFATDDCAMLLDSTGAWNIVHSTLKSDIDVTPVPIYAGTQRRANAPGGSSLWVMRGHSVREYRLVSEFLAFVLQAENQLVFSARTGYLPVTQDAAARLQSTAREPSSVTVGLAALSDIDGRPSAPLRCGFITLMRLIWSQEMENALTGRQSVEHALRQTTLRANELLSLFQQIHQTQASDGASEATP